MTTKIYELRGEPDKYPGFIQAFTSDTIDSEGWEEVISSRCLALGEKLFGTDYVPVSLEFNNDGKLKNTVGDVSLSMRPFIIMSSKACEALEAFLAPAGEFLEVIAPVRGFIGYRVLKHLDNCIDLDQSTYTRYDNGNLLIRKPTMLKSATNGHDIFAVSHTLGSPFVSSAFRAAVEAANLKGFDFSKEISVT